MKDFYKQEKKKQLKSMYPHKLGCHLFLMIVLFDKKHTWRPDFVDVKRYTGPMQFTCSFTFFMICNLKPQR